MIMINRYFLCRLVLISLIPYSIIFAENDSSKIIPYTPLPYANISLEAKVNQQSINLNKELTYEVTVKWEGHSDTYQFDILEAPTCKNLELKGSKVSNQMFPKEDHFSGIKSFSYIFKPIKEGEAIIQPLSISYIEKGTSLPRSLRTSKIFIMVLPSAFEFNSNNKIVLSLMSVFILLLLIILYVLFWKKKRKSMEIIDFPPKSSMEIQEENLCKIINAENMSPQDQFSQISSIIKKILQDKFSLNKSSVSASELIEQLEKLDISKEKNKDYKEILLFCNTIKYAGVKMVDKEQIKVMLNKIKILFLEKKG